MWRLLCLLGSDLENVYQVTGASLLALIQGPHVCTSAIASRIATYFDVFATTFWTASFSRCDSRGSAWTFMFWSLKLPYWKLFGSSMSRRETSS